MVRVFKPVVVYPPVQGRLTLQDFVSKDPRRLLSSEIKIYSSFALRWPFLGFISRFFAEKGQLGSAECDIGTRENRAPITGIVALIFGS
jgi:hypothetical protein